MVALGSPIRRSFRDNDLFSTLMNKSPGSGRTHQDRFQVPQKNGAVHREIIIAKDIPLHSVMICIDKESNDQASSINTPYTFSICTDESFVTKRLDRGYN